MKKRIAWVIISLAVAVIITTILATYPFMSVQASYKYISISLGQNITAQPKYGLTDNTDGTYTFQYEKAKTKIKIGDTDGFKPKALMMKFDDYHYYSLELNGVGLFIPTVSLDGKIEGKAIDKDFSITYSQTGIVEGFNDEGGLDIIITTGKDASNNVLSFTFNAQNVVGYLQPELTQAEIDEGGIRPDHVINSIALYCTDKGGSQETGGIEWKTGKVGHLYRMKATSYDGKVDPVWCDWSISGNVYNLTIPSDWYNDKKTKFPITIAPIADTFGYTTAGSSFTSETALWTYGPYRSIFTAPANGTATSISFRCSGIGGRDYYAAIYEVNTYKEVTAKVDLVDWAWNTSDLDSSVSITSGTNYGLALRVAQASSYFDGGFQYDTGGTHGYDTTAGAFPATWSNDSSGTRKFSIYCTYTPAASFDISNDPSTIAFGIVAASTTYYAFGSAPSNPVDPSECTFTITNNAAGACDIDMKMSDFIGGVGWNIAGSVGEDTVKITAYYEGQNPASGLVLTNSDQEFYDGLASSATLDWDSKFETGTFTDGVAKSGVLTITAVAED